MESNDSRAQRTVSYAYDIVYTEQYHMEEAMPCNLPLRSRGKTPIPALEERGVRDRVGGSLE